MSDDTDPGIVYLQRRVDQWLAGDGLAGVDLLLHLLAADHPHIPEAAVCRLRAALLRWRSGEVRTLDEALGVAGSESARAQRAVGVRALGVYASVNRARHLLREHRRQAHRPHPFGGESDPFEVAAGEWDISRAQAREYFYAARDHVIAMKRRRL